VLECPICRQPYDGRIQICVPPHHETFDTVACAQRAAEAWGWDKAAPVPVIEAVDRRSQTRVAPVTPRRQIAALAGFVVAPGRGALATGACLLAAGTAASIYLLVRTPGEAAGVSVVAAGVPDSRQTIRRPRAATPPPAVAPARPVTKAVYPRRPIKAGVTYEADSFPLSIRITPPDGTWAGAQWQTSTHGRPAFGWVSVGRLPVRRPRGLIVIETAFGRTPSAPAVLARLRSEGGGVTYGRTTRVSFAGFSGWQIDGRVVGRFGHAFVPFSPKSAGASPDSYALEKGERFRIIVVEVRGKSIVLFLESSELSAEQFRAFLTAADRVLRSLEFPG
jgi:hypothetical protein